MHYVKFERDNYSFSPPLREEVWVLVKGPYTESKAYKALWEQYPLWIPKYNSANHPPNKFEKYRHNFGSAIINSKSVTKVNKENLVEGR